MKKISKKILSESLSRNEMRKVKGGSGWLFCSGLCSGSSSECRNRSGLGDCSCSNATGLGVCVRHG